MLQRFSVRKNSASEGDSLRTFNAQGLAKAFSVTSVKTAREYYLHMREVLLSGGHRQTIYYFAPSIEANAVPDLPPRYEVVQNHNSGLPMLKKR
jgi:hypothetical protein